MTANDPVHRPGEPIKDTPPECHHGGAATAASRKNSLAEYSARLRRRLTPRSWGVTAIAIAAVFLRIPLLHLPAWPDEGGFLEVGSSWHLGSAGSSLYGDYWVDRPPLLISLYGLANRLGGLTALRLLGAAAAAMSVVGAAWAAEALAGRRAQRAALWAATCMAAFVSTPFHWAFMIDGELLALPFVVWGIAFAARGFAGSGVLERTYMAGSGALAIAAICVKQNFADVFVFAFVFGAVGRLGRSIDARKLLTAVSAFVLGAVAAVGTLAEWTALHHTDAGHVWYALYQFRLDASSHGVLRPLSLDRLVYLGWAALLSGLAVSAVAALAVCWTVSRRDAAAGALVAVLLFDLVSVMAGTDYWLHYLIQPCAPVAILLGLMIARGAPLVPIGTLTAGLAVVGWSVAWTSPPQTAEEQVGDAVGNASRPGDQIVTVPGRANVNLVAGLSSPYPYLWALPARVRDPHHRQLTTLLESPRAPTWVVAWRPLGRRTRPGTMGAALHAHYRLAAKLCGRPIYLRKGLGRPRPAAAPRRDATEASRCQSATVPPAILRSMP